MKQNKKNPYLILASVHKELIIKDILENGLAGWEFLEKKRKDLEVIKEELKKEKLTINEIISIWERIEIAPGGIGNFNNPKYRRVLIQDRIYRGLVKQHLPELYDIIGDIASNISSQIQQDIKTDDLFPYYDLEKFPIFIENYLRDNPALQSNFLDSCREELNSLLSKEEKNMPKNYEDYLKIIDSVKQGGDITLYVRSASVFYQGGHVRPFYWDVFGFVYDMDAVKILGVDQDDAGTLNKMTMEKMNNDTSLSTEEFCRKFVGTLNDKLGSDSYQDHNDLQIVHIDPSKKPIKGLLLNTSGECSITKRDIEILFELKDKHGLDLYLYNYKASPEIEVFDGSKDELCERLGITASVVIPDVSLGKVTSKSRLSRADLQFQDESPSRSVILSPKTVVEKIKAMITGCRH